MRYTLFQDLVYRKKKENLLKRNFIEKYLYRGNPKRKFENLMVKRKRRDSKFVQLENLRIYIYIYSKFERMKRFSKNPFKEIFTNLAKEERSSIRNIVSEEKIRATRKSSKEEVRKDQKDFTPFEKFLSKQYSRIFNSRYPLK